MNDIAAFSNRYTGLFTHFGALPPRAHDPDVPMWGATLIASGSRSLPIAVGGAGWTDAAARGACLGEAIERFQPYALARDGVIEGSYADWPLTESAIAPERWVLFHPDQYRQPDFPFLRLLRDTRCRWVCCRGWPNGEAVWVPEDFVYLYPRPGESHRFCPGISTGLSCGLRGDPILLRGAQEAIERDALIGAWWRRYPLEEWEPARVFASLGGDVRARLSRPNLTYRCYRVQTPYSAHVTIATVSGDDHEGYCFSAGAACRQTRGKSWRKALLEAVQGRIYARYLRGQVAAAPGSEPLDFAAHALYYSLHPQTLARTVFADGARTVDADTEQSRHEDLAALRARLGPERPILWRLLTPPAVAQDARDWQVLKVVVPGLQPMHGDHRLPQLGGPLWSPRTLADWATTPPHPFP